MMDRRIGLRIGGALAAVTCALLVACGGGGGGGSSAIPSSGSVTPTPLPVSQSASSNTSTTATTSITLGAIAGGPTNSTALFPATSVQTLASITVQASLPSGVSTAPQSRAMLHPMTLGSTPTVLAYYVVTVNPGVTISSAPMFSAQLSSALASSGYADIVLYTGSTNGWVSLAEIPVAAGATSVAFSSPAPLSPAQTLSANTPYVFALVTSAKQLLPTPTPPASAGPSASPGTAPTLPPVSGSAYGGWSPYDVASAFDLPVQHGYDGTGRTIAIFGDATPTPTDLQRFASKFSLPSNPYSRYQVVNVPNVTPTTPASGDSGEATLDVETVMGLAPGATIQFYWTQGDLSSAAFLATENAVAASNGGNGPDAFSISFGGCEQYPLPTATTPPPPPDAQIFAGMNATGVAVTVSSGDQGDQCYVGGPVTTAFGVNYPASDPSVIGVGGNETDPTAGNVLTNPTAWNDTTFSGATGGGVSTTFALPSYQMALSGAASTSMRNVPDVTMPSAGAVVVEGGNTHLIGGTSWSAPQIAAVVASMDEYCKGRPANPVAEMYKAYAANPNDFLDITKGNNKYGNDTMATYSAKSGYDNTTGLGIPLGFAVARDMCGGGAWMAVPRSFAAQLQAADVRGAARDTVLPYRARFAPQDDLGPRNAADASAIMLVMRRTSTEASDEQTVVRALTNAGFLVSQGFAGHGLIAARAPASTVNAYFRTSLHNVWQGTYGAKYANATALTLPAEIAPYVSAVLADDLVARVRMSHRIR